MPGRTSSIFLLLAVYLAAGFGGPAVAEDRVDYQRDIRPLLSDNCYACHGPDAASRKGGFRLDQRESAFGKAASGERPIVPGEPDESELMYRISSRQKWEQMPPPDFGKTLTEEQIELIRRWIEQGAEWAEHWAFVPPIRPDVPEVQRSDWPRNEIDRFLLARLEREGLAPSPEADKPTLLRRVTFDLTGLPPTPEELDAFLADDSPEAYERVVDRLLASPHYGEHQARFWLDAARYGDTHGLHLDNYREMWLYRDWVVEAFNRNLPFDRFAIEQLAGDLLPDPSDAQLIATGFNRSHVTTNEGGSIVEEVEVRNVVDRVVTTGTVFLGLTLDCTRCHDHKYDPLTMQDFYSLYGFFNNLDGSPMDGNIKDHPPVLRQPTPEQAKQIAALKKAIGETEAEIHEAIARFEYAEPSGETIAVEDAPREVVWFDDALPAGAQPQGPWYWVGAPAPVLSGDRSHTQTASGQDQHFFTGAREPLVLHEGDVLFTYVWIDRDDPPRQIMLQWNDGSWEHRAYWGEDLIAFGQNGTPSRRHRGDLPESGKWVRLEVPAADVGLAAGAKINGWAFTQFGGTLYWDKAGVVTRGGPRRHFSLAGWIEEQRGKKNDQLPKEIAELIALDANDRSEEQSRRLQDYFVEHVYAGSRALFDPLKERLAVARRDLEAVEKQVPTTLIYRERSSPKPARILNRGEYDQPGEEVARAVPQILPPLPEGAPLNRLGLAQWLVEPDHPLTARVTVNRFWQQVFGIGLVETAEDFGSQGTPPSHPQLLDWLAVQLIDDGWDVKKTLRRMVTSAAYRQSSRVTPELVQRDPKNRLLARGPRVRLDAEMLRDQALAASGLLVPTLGGPGVKPPQPPGLWEAVGYVGSNTRDFRPDSGPDKVHRRTIYTFIKRTALAPQLSTFDAPPRESCVVRRERTNTPLQALLLMNDPQFVEAARALAQRAMQQAGDAPPQVARWMFLRAAVRAPHSEELEELTALFHDHLARFVEQPQAARELLSVGEAPLDPSLDPAHLAAWTMVANLLLNLDEVIMKN